MKFCLLPLLLCLFVACKTSKTKNPNNRLEFENIPSDKEISKVSNNTILLDDSLDLKIGQMILIGLGERTSIVNKDSLLNELAGNKFGGIVIYEKNIAKSNSKLELKKMISLLKSKASLPLFVSIDEEGGKVHRLKSKYGFVDIPSALYFGNLNNTDSTYNQSKKLALAMAEVGINLNCAPDVDLGTNKKNPVIYKLERSYSADPYVVAKHALVNIKAHHDVNIKTIIKHFPGHGSSSDDSHLGLVDVTDKWNLMEVIPFQELINQGVVDGVMTAHIVNKHLDTLGIPATLSKLVVNNFLRTMLKFDGVVFSDDMQMYAISKNYGLENAIKLSILAGVDVLMFANNVNAKDRNSASEIHSIIKKLVNNGEISRTRINESFRRICKMKVGLK